MPALAYLGHGLAIVGRSPRLCLLISVVYATPALAAGYLTAVAPEPNAWEQVAVLGLPWITVVLGTVVIMVAVRYGVRGQPVTLGRATRTALRWVPRYVWTNVHTSILFWGPVGLLLAARRWQEDALPAGGVSEIVVSGVWWVAIASLAVYLHTRTLLAPFLAVHADLPGTLAALEAWRLSGQHLAICFTTLVVGSLPVGLPLALVALIALVSLPGPSHDALLAAAPDLAWAGIQIIRPVLIPAVYLLYHDLWQAELEQRQRIPPGCLPVLVRVLLRLTEPLPKLGRWTS